MPTPMKGLRYLRRSSELTQSTIAERIGVSQSHYAKIENGKTEPKVWQLVELARLFKVSIDDLL